MMINPLLSPLIANLWPWPWIPPFPPFPILASQGQPATPMMPPVQPAMYETAAMGGLGVVGGGPAKSAGVRAVWSPTDEQKQSVKNKTEDEVLAGIALASVDSSLTPFIPALVNGTRSYFADAPQLFDVDQWQTHVEKYMPPTVQSATFLAGMVVGMVVMAIILK